MNKSNFYELLKKYDNGTITPAERSLLESWYIHHALHSPDSMTDQDLELSVSSLRINLNLNRKSSFKKIWPRIATAAAIAMMVVSAGIWFLSKQISNNHSVYINDVLPGSAGATLTLANGKKIRLNNTTSGELANEAGVVITKTANGELVYEINSDPSDAGITENGTALNTLSTAKGETYQVKLPDGSVVWLNAASTLSYSPTLNQYGKRKVKLEGEGYFQVAKDKAHPFIVESKGQEVEVLGTHFNINAYKDEPSTKTTLLEGSVSVRSLAGRNQYPTVLKPDQQSILAGNTIKVEKVSTEEALAWQKGYFSFYDEHITSIMRKISRWYNIEVEYDGEIPGEKFNARITKYSSIKEVLETLENTKAVHFIMEGRKITVSK